MQLKSAVVTFLLASSALPALASTEFALASQGAALIGYSSYNAAITPQKINIALNDLISATKTPWHPNGEASFIFGQSDQNQWLKLDLGQVRSVDQIGVSVSPYPLDRYVWDRILISTSTDNITWTTWGQVGKLDGIVDITSAVNMIAHTSFSDVRYITYNFGPTSPMYGANGSRVVQLYAESVAAVPEPETYAMMLAGLGLLGFMARRKKPT